MKNPINNKTESYLEERIKHLEGVERFVIDSLEQAASLGDFQDSINKLRDVTAILEETARKVQCLIPFETAAFFLVDEDSNEFTLRHIDSESDRSYIHSEVDNAIDSGIFAWALREKRPVIVPTKDHQKSLVLHSMATATQVRGMFIGLMNNDRHNILNVSLSLVSLILFNSANAIESFELYRKIREISKTLERIDNYRLLFEAAPDGVEVVDAGGNIIEINASQKKLLGFRQEQLTGSPASDYFSEKSKVLVLNKQSSLSENGYWEGEVELVTAAGEIISIWRKEKAIYDNDHRYIGAVVYNRDITERKRIEKKLRDSEIRYRELSIVDDLTQLHNSRHFYVQLQNEMERSNRYGQPLTLLLLDLDNFKAFNDTYGHVEGDQVLSRLGKVVKRCLRETDAAYRYGGEEFTILLPMTTSEEGVVTAERIRTEIRKECFFPVSSQEVHMTVSIGLAQYKEHEDMKAFVHRVDQLMYQGKKDGKDRVCCESV